jgi:hypothetical protein
MCIVAHSNNSLKLTFILGVQPSHPSILGKYLLSLIPGVPCRAVRWVPGWMRDRGGTPLEV